MLIPILVTISVIVIVIVILINNRPTQFTIERFIVIPAKDTEIFPWIDELKNWEKWSPWDKIDPNLIRTYEGPSAGPGACYRWKGNSKVGEGAMTILDTTPHSQIKMKLEFLRPMRVTNSVEFNLTPFDNQTQIQWKMSGKNGFMSKFFDLLFNLDKMVGKDFEKGLEQLKNTALAGK